MKAQWLMTIAIAAALGNPAIADTPAKAVPTTAAQKPIKAVKPGELSCQEFLSYDEVTRPEIVYFSQGTAVKGKPKDSAVDIAQINSLVPVIVDECSRDPQGSYWQKIKADFERIF